jgi:hypothetical protein
MLNRVAVSTFDGMRQTYGLVAREKIFRSVPVAVLLLLAGCSSAYWRDGKAGIAKRGSSRIGLMRRGRPNRKREQFVTPAAFLAVEKPMATCFVRIVAVQTQRIPGGRGAEQCGVEDASKLTGVEAGARAIHEPDPAASQRQQPATRRRYDAAGADAARGRADGPVLATFRDQVLYLKHNLNARGVVGSTHRALKPTFRG